MSDLSWGVYAPDALIVRRDPTVTHLAGVEIPEESRTLSASGVIVDIGADVNLSLGDHVVFGPYAGVQLPQLGAEYQVIREGEIVLYQRKK